MQFKSWLKIEEMGVGPYIGNCVDTDDYQVVGACSDQNSEELNAKYRNSGVDHKKVKKHSQKVRDNFKP